MRNLEKICKSKFLLLKPLMFLNKDWRVKRGFLEQRTICWQGEGKGGGNHGWGLLRVGGKEGGSGLWRVGGKKVGSELWKGGRKE